MAHAFLFGRHPRRTLLRVVLLVAGATVVFGWVLLPVRAEGISMEPTYEPGSFHLVNRLAYRARGPARGDVVAIRLAGPHVVYVKRVIGLPGEHVRISGGQVFIDDRALAEPYVRRRNPSWNLPQATLGADEYFVVGDNRAMRIELHELGVAHRRRMVGKVIY